MCHRALITGQVRGERDRDGFALATAIGEDERQHGADAIVETVRRLLPLGEQQFKALGPKPT